jgi:hypothetical protein
MVQEVQVTLRHGQEPPALSMCFCREHADRG